MPHLQTTLTTLLEKGTSHRQIERITGIDRNTNRLMPERISAIHDRAMARLREGAPPHLLGKVFELVASRKNGEELSAWQAQLTLLQTIPRLDTHRFRHSRPKP